MSEIERKVFEPSVDDLILSTVAMQIQGRVGRTTPGIYIINQVVKGEVVNETVDETITAKELESSKEQ